MATMSPMDLLNKIKNKAKLDEVDYGNIIAVKLNKAGKIKMQLVALDSENLFKSRVQHFIQTVPENDDPNEKVMVVDCQGENCPICSASETFRNCGITTDMINAAYKPKYPYTKLRNFLTMPEHYIVCAQILADNAEEGNYLPKEAELGSTQFVQLPKSALNSLMEAYEDFIEENEDDLVNLPPLFAIFEDGVTKAKSLTVNCRIQTQPFAYNFTFGKAVETDIESVDKEKLSKLAEGPLVPTEDYMNKAIKRINDIKEYFVGASKVSTTVADRAVKETATEKINNIVDDDFDLDQL